MGKLVQISSDGGSNWDDLPGGNANFNVEAEGVDDTIFGQTFSSQEVGLLQWNISVDGIFKGFAGYLANILKIGTPTEFTTEAMTVVSGKTFAINDSAKEIWDRDTGVTFKDVAEDVAESDILSVDYLFGRVTFTDSYTVTGAITADTGNYYPMVAIGTANAYTLTMSANAVDESDFETAQANGGYRTFASGLRTVSLELGGIFDSTEASAGDLLTRSELIIEVDPAGDGSSIARGFFKTMTAGQGGAVGAIEDETVNFQLTVPQDEKVEFVFNWRHTATTLATAIQNLITSWLTELNTYNVQYMPQGSIGQTPVDAKEGDFVVTDISLSGGLSNMNVFTAELRGTGVVNTV